MDAEVYIPVGTLAAQISMPGLKGKASLDASFLPRQRQQVKAHTAGQLATPGTLRWSPRPLSSVYTKRSNGRYSGMNHLMRD